MPEDDLIIAVALIEFAIHTRSSNPVLADRAEQLAADHLDGELVPREVVAEIWELT